MMRDTVRKYMPYSPLEFDRIECWLEELAFEGLELTDISGRFAKFKRAEPRRVRYRIGRSDCGRRTKWETEYLDGCKELGWDFVTILGSEYYVFRPEDENAVEFYTDREAFMRDLGRKIRRESLGTLVIIAMIVLNFQAVFSYLGSGEIFISMVEDGFALFPYGIGMLLIVIALGQIVSLALIRRRLSAGEAAEPGGRSCRDRKIRAAALAFALVLLVAWFGYAWYTVRRDSHSERYNLQTYDYNYEFPLLDEINPGEWNDVVTRIEENPNSSLINYVFFKHTVLAPVIVMTRQNGYDQHAYAVDYYALRSEKLAEKFIDAELDYLSGFDVVTEEIAFDGFDTVRYGVSDDGSAQDLLIRKGNIVITVWYVGDSSLPDCLLLYAAHLA